MFIILTLSLYFINFTRIENIGKKGLTILSDLLVYAVIPIIVSISIIIGIATTNNIVLIMTSPVANGKSDFDSLATIGNTAITGPADCTDVYKRQA